MRMIPMIACSALLAAGSASAATVHYEVDPSHTYPSFEADHLGVSTWRGKFNKSSGKITLDKEAGTGTVDIRIETASIDFGYDDMNTHAYKSDYFDTAKFPEATYKGKLEQFKDGKPSRVIGELTLRGITKPVDLSIRHFKCIPHPMNKRELCGADATTTIQRDDFGIDAGKAYGFSMDVLLRIQIEAVAAE